MFLLCSFHGAEIWISRSNWDTNSCFFALDVSQTAIGRHVANAVFAAEAPTEIPPGNTKEGGS